MEGKVLRVSVIIPTLNEEAVIRAAIDSARQAGADEIIVADGGSTDRTVEIASVETTVVRSETAARAAQQNAGAAVATGDVLLFLHADCELHINGITEMRERCELSSDFVAGCFYQRIDLEGWRFRMTESGNQWRVRLLRWAYGDQGIFVAAEAFRDLGGFPDVKFLEDLLLMKSLKGRGSFLLLSSPLKVSARRWQRRGLFRQTFRNWAIVIAAQFGASPNWLARFYPNDR